VGYIPPEGTLTDASLILIAQEPVRMRLNLTELQRVVERTIDEERAVDALKGEIRRVLGPVVITEGRLEHVVAEANDRLDVLHRTGRDGQLDFLSNITTTFIDHKHPEVRRFAARIIPERFLPKMVTDKDAAVRAAVAMRVPMPAVREMMKRFKHDDQLRAIYRQRKQALHEAGISPPKAEPLGHDPVDGAERMGDVARTAEGPELSDAWYDEQARLFIHDYARAEANDQHARLLDRGWASLVVRRFCASTKATAHVEIDAEKLLKHVNDLMEEKDDRTLERDAMKETLAWLGAQDINESALPEFHEIIDPVRALLEANLSQEQYVAEALKLFNVKRSELPKGIRKYCLGEANLRVTLVPCLGSLPHQHGFRAVDERALDKFCESWNDGQALVGEPFVLNWGPHQGDASKVNFTVTLK